MGKKKNKNRKKKAPVAEAAAGAPQEPVTVAPPDVATPDLPEGLSPNS